MILAFSTVSRWTSKINVTDEVLIERHSSWPIASAETFSTEFIWQMSVGCSPSDQNVWNSVESPVNEKLKHAL